MRRVAAGAALIGIAVVGLLAVLPAKGGGTASTPTVVKVTAGEPKEFAFTLSRSTALSAGTVVFQVTNRGALAHGFKLCAKPVASAKSNACAGSSTTMIKPGKTAKLSVTFATSGQYEFLATTPGEAAKGMKGLIGVTAAPAGSGSKTAPAATTSTPLPGATTTSPAATTPAPGATTAGTGDATAGAALFETEGCSSCHTFADARANGPIGPNLNTSHPLQFPHGALSPSQLADLAAYLNR